MPSDAQALRTYTETYNYDCVGNFSSLVHGAANGNWTRTYAYDEPNQPPTNNRLTSTTVGGRQRTYTLRCARQHDRPCRTCSLMAWDFKDQLQATQTAGRERPRSRRPITSTTPADNASARSTETATGAMANERIYLGGFEVYREYDASGRTTLERQTLHVMDDKRRVAMVETLTKGNDADRPRASYDPLSVRQSSRLGLPRARCERGDHLVRGILSVRQHVLPSGTECRRGQPQALSLYGKGAG